MRKYQEKLDQLLLSLEESPQTNVCYKDFFDSNTLPMLIAYCEMIEKWNKSHDLVSQKNSIEIFSHHILDCVAAFLVFITQHKSVYENYIDIGTGAGLPGVVWHLCFSQKVKTLLFEPRAKRVHFLKEVRRVLSLDNLTVTESRFNIEGLSLGNTICSMRALKPEREMFTQLKSVTKTFSLVSLTTSTAEFKDVDNSEIRCTHVEYSYQMPELINRELRICS